MTTLSKFRKYILRFTLYLAFFVFSVILLFLYKPSYFLTNIENYFSNSFESYFVDFDVEIKNIEGNFFSGFNIDNISVKHNSSLILYFKNIYIEPDLFKSLLEKKFVFNFIKIDDFSGKELYKIKLKPEFQSKSVLLNPSISIKKLVVNSGILDYKNESVNFSTTFNTLISGDNIVLDFENINFKTNNYQYFSKKGNINFSKKGISIKNFDFSDDSNLNARIDLNLNLFPLELNKVNISILNANLNLHDKLSISHIHLSSLPDKKEFKYALEMYSIINNNEEYFDIIIDKDDYKISFKLEKQNFGKNIFSIFGDYDLLDGDGKFNIVSNSGNPLKIDGGVGLIVNSLSDFDIDLFINSASYNNYQFDEISGFLNYSDGVLTSSNLLIREQNESIWNINKLAITSFLDIFIDGTLKAPDYNLDYSLGNKFSLTTNDSLNFKNSRISYKYTKKQDYLEFYINGFSERIDLGELYLFSPSYSISYSDSLVQVTFKSEKMEFNNYSFSFADFKYKDGEILFKSENEKSGEFFDIKSRILDSGIFIDRLSAKINNTEINMADLRIDRLEDYYVSSGMIIYLDDGLAKGHFKYKNIYNYSLNLDLSQIDLSKIDKLMFLNNRYSGFASGRIDFTITESNPLLDLNFTVDNLKFDDFHYDEASINISLKNNILFIDNFKAFSNNSSLNIAGFIKSSNTFENFHLSKKSNIEINGFVKSLDISILNKYFPWAISMGGVLTTDLSISGMFDDINFNISPVILNPVFDKIQGIEIGGNVSCRNNRLFFSDIIGKTKYGEYRILGSLPANFNFHGKKDIDSRPIYIDIEAKSTSLELLAPYFPFVKETSGIFDYKLNIHGNYKNIIRNGEITIENASLNIFQLDNPIDNINAYALIDNNRLIFNYFSATLSRDEENSIGLLDGFASSVKDVLRGENSTRDNVDLSGSIDLKSFFNPDFSINIIGNNNYLSSSYGQFEGFASSNITITGQDTILISGQFEPKFNQFTLFDIENRQFSSRNYQEITGNNFIAYDIFIPFQNGIKIKSDNIDLFLEGEMNLSSFSNNNISVSGKANIIDGHFFYNGNEFYNTEGVIFIDPVIKTPYIEVHSTTDIYEDNINVSFIGYTDNPNLILDSSIPNYSQSDILQLLTFRDKNVDNSITEPFGNIIGNYLETQLEKNVTLYTDLDEFRVQHSGSLMKGFSESDINVFMGKRISNRLYLNTKINLNDNDLNEYEMSYRVSNRSSVVAKIDDNKYWQLNYRFKYKY